MLICTIHDFDYSRVDDRCLTHDGCVVDLGCSGWGLFNFFSDKKRIIGVDPYESKIDGVDFFEGMVGPVNGDVYVHRAGSNTTCFGNIDCENEEFARVFKMLSWKNFCKKFEIDKVSFLKINIEGAEFSLLNSMDSEDFSKIDQIAISLHDFDVVDDHENILQNKNLNKNLLSTSLFLLEKEGYHIEKINDQWNWYLAIKDNDGNLS